MVEPGITFVVALLYFFVLFIVASYGDRRFANAGSASIPKPNIYALSMAVYCTTWTFFGSVGLAASSGLNFLAIYVGPILMVTVGYTLMQRVLKIAKSERITSVADFLGSRYGKNNKVAAVAAIIAVIGTIPYIALQLKAIASSVGTLFVNFEDGLPKYLTAFGDISLFIAFLLAIFAVLFGTRHADATEHQNGLMLAIAMESVVKLVAFVAVGVFATWGLFGGFADLFNQALESDRVMAVVNSGFDTNQFFILTFLSLSAFLLLPRQFHVAVVENNSPSELKRARWLFPTYLVAINFFVIPIAIAGMIIFDSTANADDFVLLLPTFSDQRALGLLVFIGGLSAGTAMVIVACVALAIMISNDLILPLVLRFKATETRDPINMETQIMQIRRMAIFGVLILAFLYYRAADNSAALASIGLVSFAAITQLAPPFFFGLYWRESNARGAIVGMMIGFSIWSYCLFFPTLLSPDHPILIEGPMGWGWLRPQNLFGLNLDPLANGVFWSIFMNTASLVLISLTRDPNPQEQMQASVFVRNLDQIVSRRDLERSDITISQLKDAVSRYIGNARTDRSFDAYWHKGGVKPEPNELVGNDLLRFSEQLLASSIGASSSRLVHTLLLKRYNRKDKPDLKLLDEASRALQFNRDVLQTAIDQLDQGISVFRSNYELASWNTNFRAILNLPEATGQAGTSLRDISKQIVECNEITEFATGGEELAKRLVTVGETWQLVLPRTQDVLEVTTSAMPQGGIVILWHNITERVQSANALREANETLEKRVEERTFELEIAKQAADQANVSKTRFLAAASHDVLQPLNAAKLYSATLSEKELPEKEAGLTSKINRSLESVEEILGSVLAISRLDSPQYEADVSNFALREVTEQLELEFTPIAKVNNLELIFVHSSAWVRSDRALLRRLLQNLVSNALKFTRNGKVLVGARKQGEKLLIQVYDTGIGIQETELESVFTEFNRLEQNDDFVPGLGLGLSIVERISKLLDHPIEIDSEPGKGTKFTVTVDTVTGMKMPTPRPRNKSTRANNQLNGTKVLCIENDEHILEGMFELLNQWGCDVATAKDRAEAVSRLQSFDQAPDIVLTDYHLNNETGVELVNYLSNKFDWELNTVVITADRSDLVKHEVEENKMRILNKPVRPASLRAVIAQYRRKNVAAE